MKKLLIVVGTVIVVVVVVAVATALVAKGQQRSRDSNSSIETQDNGMIISYFPSCTPTTIASATNVYDDVVLQSAQPTLMTRTFVPTFIDDSSQQTSSPMPINSSGASSKQQPSLAPTSSRIPTPCPSLSPSSTTQVQTSTFIPTTVLSTSVPTTTPFSSTIDSLLDGMKGSIVTDDCKFNDDYSYAIDIFWSCGSEQFNEALRLHTFKRHSYEHRSIFNDQLITYRNKHLWFDNYDIPRCIQIEIDDNSSGDSGGELKLTADDSNCSFFSFVLPSTSSSQQQTQPSQYDDFYIFSSNGKCLGLGGQGNCNSDRSTGGSECGGVDHRYLPLVVVDDCDNNSAALLFHFETQVQDCSNNGATEFPNNLCF